MMDFQQRKDEILRRSAQRLQARRQLRKRIVMTCVPLAVCVAAFSAWILGGGVSLKSADDTLAYIAESGSMNGQTAENTAEGLASVQVDTGDAVRVYTDAQTLQAVSRLVQSLEEDGGSDGEGTVAQGTPSYADNEQYTLILTSSAGTQHTYILRGDQLTDRNSGTSCELDAAQLEELRKLLGLGAR